VGGKAEIATAFYEWPRNDKGKPCHPERSEGSRQ